MGFCNRELNRELLPPQLSSGADKSKSAVGNSVGNCYPRKCLTLLTLALLSSLSLAQEVHHHGALKNFMHKGDISAKYDLRELEALPHVYALGALEELQGEILILDGTAFVSRAAGDSVRISQDFQHRASLLVYTQVAAWEESAVPDTLSDSGAFEKWFAEELLRQGRDTNAITPFLLRGTASAIDWHVIQWDRADSLHTHAKHVESGPHGSFENISGEILGFYSRHHKAVFTHHTSFMHMHVLGGDGKLAGHVDRLLPGKDMTLLLPVVVD